MRMIKKLLRFILIILIIAFAVIYFNGKKFYEETISEKPLKEKVEEIREDYNYVKKDEMPKYYLDAIVAVEDRRYYNHGAVDYIGILRAIYTNIKTKGLQEGGSTITQQVAKNLYYEKEKNVVKRKVAEAFIANDLEKNYSKDEILELYANIIYFGDGYYGIKEACEGYLKKEPKDMSLSEATMMAGIPNAPSAYAPTVNKKLCKQRQMKVVSSMVSSGYIRQDEADSIDQTFIDKIE